MVSCAVGGECIDRSGGTVTEEPHGFGMDGLGEEKRGERYRDTQEKCGSKAYEF